jgi:hypothetical protein
MVFFFPIANFSEPLACTCQKEQSVVHLSDPSAALARLLGDVQAAIKIAGFH